MHPVAKDEYAGGSRQAPPDQVRYSAEHQRFFSLADWALFLNDKEDGHIARETFAWLPVDPTCHPCEWHRYLHQQGVWVTFSQYMYARDSPGNREPEADAYLAWLQLPGISSTPPELLEHEDTDLQALRSWLIDDVFSDPLTSWAKETRAQQRHLSIRWDPNRCQFIANQAPDRGQPSTEEWESLEPLGDPHEGRREGFLWGTGDDMGAEHLINGDQARTVHPPQGGVHKLWCLSIQGDPDQIDPDLQLKAREEQIGTPQADTRATTVWCLPPVSDAMGSGLTAYVAGLTHTGEVRCQYECSKRHEDTTMHSYRITGGGGDGRDHAEAVSRLLHLIWATQRKLAQRSVPIQPSPQTADRFAQQLTLMECTRIFYEGTEYMQGGVFHIGGLRAGERVPVPPNPQWVQF